MKPARTLVYCLLLVNGACAKGQSAPTATPIHLPQKTTTMITASLKHPVVKQAIDALQAGDLKAWNALFSKNASLWDDGRKIDLGHFSQEALGHERFTAIDKVAREGLDIYGRFHSDRWGDFKTYFKFYIDDAGKIEKLEIGQVSY